MMVAASSAQVPDDAALQVTGGAAPGYVPDAACAECHREHYDSYQHVGMARSFYKPSADNLIEDFESNHYYHAASNQHFEMRFDDGRMRVRRYRVDTQGRHVAEFEQVVDWVIGSGNHSRGYLYQTASGELFQLPVVWYTQEKQWGMAPGYDRPDHEGFTRPITRDCMACHNAYPDVPAGSDRFGQPHIFPLDMPEGIGCQRCHGPGADHVRTARSDTARIAEARATIVNPANLSAKLRDDVCLQCHLQPTSKLTSFARRLGTGDYAYRPGEPLEEHLLYFDHGSLEQRAQRFEINHHPYRLMQSRCFKASDGRLSCLTCHDVHRVVPEGQRPAHYRNACLTCHAADDAASANGAIVRGAGDEHHQAGVDCIACHMPKRRTDDVVHVVMTDHLIQRGPIVAAGYLRPKEESPPPRGVSMTLYRPSTARDDAEVALWRAMIPVIDGDVSYVPKLAEAIEALNIDDPAPKLQLATTAMRAGAVRQAASILGQLVERDPSSAITRSNLGIALGRMGRVEAAIDELTRAAALEPRLPETHYNLAVVLARAGRSQEAEHHYRETIRLRPTHAAARFNLANQLARQGAWDAAAEQFRSTIAIEPDREDGFDNLSAVYRQQERWQEAIDVLRQGIATTPRHDELLMELALCCLEARGDARDVRLAGEAAMLLAQRHPADINALMLLAAAAMANDNGDEARATADRLEFVGDGAACAACVRELAGSREDAAAATPPTDATWQQCVDQIRHARIGRLIEGMRNASTVVED